MSEIIVPELEPLIDPRTGRPFVKPEPEDGEE